MYRNTPLITLCKLSLISLCLASVLTPALANSIEEKIETIEVSGAYLEGYNAHAASGASRMELAIKDIPQSVSVITNAQLEDFLLTNTNVALDTATGVNVERIETDRTYYTARGFDITNFQTDGVGLPLTNGNNHAGIDSAIYDRIEIIRGANGLMTGVGNPSATVNFIRKRPMTQNSLNLSGTVGSHSLQRLQLDGTQHFSDSLSGRLVLVEQTQDSYLDRYSRHNQAAYLFLNAELSENTQVSLSHSYDNSEATGNLWGALPLYYTDGSATAYSRNTSTSADWSFWDVTNNSTVFELNHQFSTDWRLRATYSQKRTDEDSNLFYVFGTPDRATEAGLTGYTSEYLLADERKTFDVYVEGDFVFLNREHQVVFGVNTAVAEYTDQSLYDFTTGNGFPEIPNLQTWKGNAVYPTLADGLAGSAVKQTQDAWYATGRFSIIDSLHLMLGGRYNQWETKGTSYRVDRTVKDSDFIPFAGLVYDITGDINVYTSYTETFQAQQELDINNQQLDPVVGQSQEIGFKFDLFNEQAVASIAYFDVQQTNLAILDPQTADFAPDAVRYIGSNGISSHGFELDIAGEILPDLQASIGFTDFSISGESTVAAYTPGQLFKMGLVYTVDQDLSTGINIRWQDDISRDQGVVGDGFSNAGEAIITRQETYAVVDLMAKYQVNKSVSVALNVQNATDKKYLTSLYWAQGFYAPPRTISVTLSWTL